MVYSMRRFVLCLTLCHFVLLFVSHFSIAITSLGEERVNLSAFRTFVWFVLVWICRFPLRLCVWEGLQFVIVALPGLFSYLCFDVVKTIYALKIVQQFWIFKTFGWTDGWIFEVMTVGSNKHIHIVKKLKCRSFVWPVKLVAAKKFSSVTLM